MSRYIQLRFDQLYGQSWDAPEAAQPFSRLLIRWRTRRQLSQSALAAKSGIDHSMVSRLESGDRNPSRKMCHKLAKALCLDGTDRFMFYGAAGFFESNTEYASLLHAASTAERRTK